MDIDDSAPDAAPSLRERRRLDTSRDIADAALDLFERRGFHGTTADDIADAAGVSPRTFFRYSATKEDALFLAGGAGEGDPDPIIARTLDALAAGGSIVSALETGFTAFVSSFDDGSPADRERALRVRRLVRTEPSLLARALARDEKQGDELVRRILETHGGETDEFGVRAIVTSAGVVVRLAFDEWARRAESGEDATVRSLYDRLRATLGTHFGATSRS